MEDLIKQIEEAMVYIPADIMKHGTKSGIPLGYVQGVLAGRDQAINILNTKMA